MAPACLLHLHGLSMAIGFPVSGVVVLRIFGRDLIPLSTTPISCRRILSSLFSGVERSRVGAHHHKNPVAKVGDQSGVRNRSRRGRINDDPVKQPAGG